MAENKFTVTVNGQEVQFIECCDCGLVHEVYYDIYENKIVIHFEREEERTEKARIKRAGGKGKLMCQLLDDAIARDGGMINVK